jgi:hypothetical protein
MAELASVDPARRLLTALPVRLNATCLGTGDNLAAVPCCAVISSNCTFPHRAVLCLVLLVLCWCLTVLCAVHPTADSPILHFMLQVYCTVSYSVCS